MDLNFSLPADFAKNSPKKDLKLPEGYNEVVVHCCCAPCSSALIECLLVNGIKPHLFFYNPNIYPAEEYIKRRDEWVHFCNLLNLNYTIGDYSYEQWKTDIKGQENEPERGGRCLKCFALRLTATAKFAKDKGIFLFTTTLCTSRWKSKEQVNRAGFIAQETVEGSKFWDQDWRKEGLVGRRYELVKEINFYNQLYCGCQFSINNSRYSK